jgi:bifunctional non-homologous end joining protein LigD
MSPVRKRNPTPRAASGFIEPCLPTPAVRPPSGDEWLHEIKHDGFRMFVRRDGAGTRLITRNGHDFTSRFPLVVLAAYLLPIKSFVIDGEVVVCRDDGVSCFESLRSRRHDKAAILYAFDIIELAGQDLRREPLIRRKERLARALRKAPIGLQLSEHMEGDAAVIFTHACRMGLEGIVSKRRDSRYRSSRSPDWIKLGGRGHRPLGLLHPALAPVSEEQTMRHSERAKRHPPTMHNLGQACEGLPSL